MKISKKLFKVIEPCDSKPITPELTKVWEELNKNFTDSSDTTITVKKYNLAKSFFENFDIACIENLPLDDIIKIYKETFIHYIPEISVCLNLYSKLNLVTLRFSNSKIFLENISDLFNEIRCELIKFYKYDAIKDMRAYYSLIKELALIGSHLELNPITIQLNEIY